MPDRIASGVLHQFVEDFLAAHGVATESAASVARHMVWCEMVGRRNFGLERLPILVRRLAAGVLTPRPHMRFADIAPSIARLDGDGGFGYEAAACAMDRAIALARACGVGIVGVRNSNFFGAGAYYVNQAAAAGMIGLALSNSFPKVVAHGGIRPVLGTNPFAFGAPRRDGDHLLFDMATAALAGSTLREHIAKGVPLPEGLAIDEGGRPITDPRKAAAGALLPFGGAKGFGLSLLVEILAGVITGAGVGDGVASMYNDFARNGDNGHFLMALDIGRWIDIETYHARFDGLVAAIKASGDSLLLPGEVRWQNYREAEARGIELDPAVAAAIAPLAAAKGIALPA